jgi:hypothetical protein
MQEIMLGNIMIPMAMVSHLNLKILLFKCLNLKKTKKMKRHKVANPTFAISVDDSNNR